MHGVLRAARMTPRGVEPFCAADNYSAPKGVSFKFPFLVDINALEHTLFSMQLSKRISIHAGRRSGKPCIRDTRITVYNVLSYLASGMTEQEVLEDFPSLEREDILACYTRKL